MINAMEREPGSTWPLARSPRKDERPRVAAVFVSMTPLFLLGAWSLVLLPRQTAQPEVAAGQAD